MNRVPVHGPTTLCYDVSHWQQNLNLHAHMKQLGAKVCMVKTSESTSIHDDMMKKHIAAAKAAGMVVGYYHFNRANKDPMAQARLFESIVGKLGPDDLGPILDVETLDGMTKEATSMEVVRFINELSTHFGRKVIIYGGPYSLDGVNLPASILTKCVLWVAHYGPAPARGPLVPHPFSKWHFWQFTDGGKSHIDQSYFAGTLEDLKSIG